MQEHVSADQEVFLVVPERWRLGPVMGSMRGLCGQCARIRSEDRIFLVTERDLSLSLHCRNVYDLGQVNWRLVPPSSQYLPHPCLVSFQEWRVIAPSPPELAQQQSPAAAALPLPLAPPAVCGAGELVLRST